MLDFPGIYKIQDKDNGIVYIGQSLNVRKRIQSHINHFKNKTHLEKDVYRMMNKPEFEVIEYLEDLSLLNQREIYWIGHYDSFLNGANMTMGGDWNKVKSCIHMIKNRELTSAEEERIENLLSYSNFQPEPVVVAAPIRPMRWI